MGKLTKSAIVVAVLMFVSKILGLFREILLASCFGTTYIIDAYSIACSLPTVLFSLFASGFARSYIPVISRIKENNRNAFFCNTTCLLLVISFVVSFFCFIFANNICKIMAPGFEGEVAQITEFFIKCVVFYLPPYTIFNIFCAQSAFDEDFIYCYFCDFIVVNCFVILSIFIAFETNANVLVYGYVAAMFFAVVLLGLRLWWRGQKFILKFDFKDNNFINLAKMAIPIGLGTLVNQINAIVDKMFSSMLGEGVTSALGYANRLQLLPFSLVVSIFVTVCNPRMNVSFAEGNVNQGMLYARKALLIAIYISFPLVLLLFLNSVPLTAFLFKRGQFDGASTNMTANCLKFYSLGIMFYALREIAVNVLTAILKQKLILRNTLCSVFLNIFLNIVFIKHIGYMGLAISTSISGFVAAVLMITDLHKLKLKLFVVEQIPDFLKIIASSVISIILCSVTYKCLYVVTTSSNLAILVATTLAAIIYLILSIALDIDIVIWLYKRMPEKIRVITKWNLKN